MLDRSDERDGYLTAWEQIRMHANDALTYRADARLAATRMAPFILGRTRDTLHVHFLFPTSHRKAVIERKGQAQRAGRRLGNRRHHPQNELSASERRRRLDRIVARARATAPMGSKRVAITSGTCCSISRTACCSSCCFAR